MVVEGVGTVVQGWVVHRCPDNQVVAHLVGRDSTAVSPRLVPGFLVAVVG